MAPQVTARILLSAGLVLLGGVSTRGAAAPATATRKVANSVPHPLPAELESELKTIRAAPLEAIGWGDKAYLPYQPTTGQALIGSTDPAVTTRLAKEARGGGDRAYRLAVTHLLGMRADAGVDAALIGLLADRELTATAAYLLGRVGFKGYPRRARDEASVIAALRSYLDDFSEFIDPFYNRTFRTQDFVVGALVRLLGPEHFHTTDDDRVADQIGYALPWWNDKVRAELLGQIRSVK